MGSTGDHTCNNPKEDPEFLEHIQQQLGKRRLRKQSVTKNLCRFLCLWQSAIYSQLLTTGHLDGDN